MPRSKKGAGYITDKYYGLIAIPKNLQHYEYGILTCDGEENCLLCETYLLLWCFNRNKSVFARAGAYAQSPEIGELQ